MSQLHADLAIRRPRRADLDAVIELHHRAFRARGANRHSAYSQLRQDTLVATLDGAPVGFGCWELTRIPGPEIGDLLACLEPTTRAILAPADPVLELPLRIEAPEGLAPLHRPGDTVFTALAVHPGLRRRGIGTALARARLVLARTRGSRSVFVHCVTGSGSRALYEGLGFTALVTKEAHYSDGAGMTLMWRGLRG